MTWIDLWNTFEHFHPSQLVVSCMHLCNSSRVCCSICRHLSWFTRWRTSHVCTILGPVPYLRRHQSVAVTIRLLLACFARYFVVRMHVQSCTCHRRACLVLVLGIRNGSYRLSTYVQLHHENCCRHFCNNYMR